VRESHSSRIPELVAILFSFYSRFLSPLFKIMALHYGSVKSQGKSSLTIHLLGQGNSDHSNTGGGGC